MSSSIVAEPTLHPTTQMQAGVRKYPRDGRFYWTNAGFPKELDRSNREYTRSPLRSFRTLPPLGPFVSERELLRECRDTSINFKTIDGRQLRGRKQFNKPRLCYLAFYNQSTNEGVIFLGTTIAPDNAQRFVTMQSRFQTDVLEPGSLGTNPFFSFCGKNRKPVKTYLNISHPLRVQFAYFLNRDQFPRCEEKGIYYNGHEPPLVSIANFITQSSDIPISPNDGLETSIVFDKESEQLFWKRHKEYHRQRPGQLGPDDDSGGTGPDDDSGGAGPDDDSGGAGPDDDSGGAGPDDDSGKVGRGNDSGGDGLGDGCSSSGGTGPNVGGGGSSKGGFSSCKAEDAPWGRVGDQRIGIDIPLVTEDIYSDSDEEMDLEESVINSDANDAPWGRVGDQRIGIDIPLVIEDIYSDPDDEMDLEPDEELPKFDNDPNKSESSDQRDITTWPNPICEGSSQSYTIPKPYFVIFEPFESVYALLNYEYSIGKWRWKPNACKVEDIIVSIEGLSYEYQFLLPIDQSKPTRRIFNWHTEEYITLPPPPDECFNLEDGIVGMIVDTSEPPYAFKVIEGNDKGTIIYNSKEEEWTQQLSVRPHYSTYCSIGNANVASCKGVVFIIDSNNNIVLYNTKNDKWARIQYPGVPRYESIYGIHHHFSSTLGYKSMQLSGIGSWDDRIFPSTYCMPQHGTYFVIWELVGRAYLEWKEFDAMPTEMYSWLINGKEVNHDFRFSVSYCSQNLLIWAWLNSSAKRFVLYNLARKTWEKLELPFLKIDGSGNGHGRVMDMDIQLTSM